MSECEICDRILPPTDLMLELAAKYGLKYIVSDNQLVLVPIEEDDNAEHA